MLKQLFSAGAIVLAGVVSTLALAGPGVANASTGPAAAQHQQTAGAAHSVRPDTIWQIQNCDGLYEQFMVGSGNALYHRWQSSVNGPYSHCSSLCGYLITDIAAIRNVTCRLEVFGVGGDHAMWHIWQTNPGSGPWSNWSSLGGYLTSNPSAYFLSNGEAVVQANGGDGNPW